jgi:hypothetical protein
MAGNTLSVYESADWGARIAGVAQARRDAAGALFMDDVRVIDTRVSGHFSVLSCADGSTRVVLTSFLRLVPNAARGEQPFNRLATEGQ